MDIYKLKFTKLQSEIFRFLCVNAGNSFNKREIALALKISPTAIGNALVLLEKENMVKSNKLRNKKVTSISFNRDHGYAVNLKRTENLRMIYESGLCYFLLDNLPGCTIFLFGSYSRGEDVWFGEDDDRNSDLDIAVIGLNEKNINLKSFERILKRKIIINFYGSWGKIHEHLKNNILNGILLSGSVEL